MYKNMDMFCSNKLSENRTASAENRGGFGFLWTFEVRRRLEAGPKETLLVSLLKLFSIFSMEAASPLFA